jgi:hypothetical protein
MKKYLLHLILAVVVLFCSYITIAQTDLAHDQNPNYAVSRSKYMQIADSLNEWHSTTQHNIYKAIDWLADRKEARADRREFRRQLRMERARWDYDYYNGGYYSGNYYYRNSNNRYRYNNYNYRRNRSFGISPWYGLNFWWR